MQNKLGMDKIQGSHKLEWLYVLFPVRIYFTSSKKGNGLPGCVFIILPGCVLDAYLNTKIYYGSKHTIIRIK